MHEKVYADLIKCHFIATVHSQTSLDVTTDEENVIRYVAGFVPFKLLKHYIKSSSADAIAFLECLSSWMVMRAVCSSIP